MASKLLSKKNVAQVNSFLLLVGILVVLSIIVPFVMLLFPFRRRRRRSTEHYSAMLVNNAMDAPQYSIMQQGGWSGLVGGSTRQDVSTTGHYCQPHGCLKTMGGFTETPIRK